MIDYMGWLALDLILLAGGGVLFYFSIFDKWYKQKLEKENDQLKHRITELEKPVDEVKTRKDKEWTERLNRAVERTINELEAKHSELIQEKTTAINDLTEQYKQLEQKKTEQYKQLEQKNHDLLIRIETFNSTIDRAKKELDGVMNKGINLIAEDITEALDNFYRQEYTYLEAELTQVDEDYNKLLGDLRQTTRDYQKRIDTLEKEKQDALADKALAQRELREYKDATSKVLGKIDRKARRKISEASLANLKYSHTKEKDETKGTTPDS